MCGIVGYIGKGVIQDKLTQGLQKLEYRGYDSAGMALSSYDNQLHLLKRKGNLSNLKQDLPDFVSSLPAPVISGIAHTRWATHGRPSEVNAHPHFSGDESIAVVHNGIIENYMQLKEELIQHGYIFKSETDTEILAHLIEHHYQDNIFEAVISALKLVEGAYGLAVVSSADPGVIVAARKSSPLIIGLAEDGAYIASDVVGVIQDTNKVIHLDDYDVAEVYPDKPPVIKNGKNGANGIKHPKITTIDFRQEEASKGKFEDYMLKEIYDQPDTIRNSTRGRLIEEKGLAKLSGMNGTAHEIGQIKKIVIIACGTSRFAGMVGEYAIEQFAGIPVEVEYASEFRYRNPVVDSDTVVLAVSQSGETADTLAALQEAKLKGAKVFGIVNSVSSAIAREAGRGIYLHAGPEISVASTKAFTSQVIVLLLLALLFGRTKHLSLTDGQQIVKEISQLPEKIEDILLNLHSKIKEVASYLKNFDHVFYIGRSYNYPTALEGALKLKEISYIHAEGYEAAELKHGPIALLEETTPVVAILNKQAGYEKMIGSVKEVMAREAPVICIGTEGDKQLDQLSKHVLLVPECPEYLSPVLNAVVMQLLAYEVAKAKGLNVDQPRNLAKSVTVE